MSEILGIIIGSIGIIFGLIGIIIAYIQKKKYKSPFLHKYPLGHPMSPIPDINEVKRKAHILYKSGVSEILGVNLNSNNQLNLVEKISKFCQELPYVKKPEEKYRYTFDNFFFTGHDAIILYSLLRYFKPNRVIEIGSGYSSALMLDTRELYSEVSPQFTFIEPYPQRLNELMKEDDKSTCEII